MNGGEVLVCDYEDGCGESFEIKREYIGQTVTCPYCGEPCGGPSIADLGE